MGFKKLRGVRLSEEKQGAVRFVCLTYADQPKQIQEKITRLCDKYGGAYSDALFEVMTTRRSVVSVAMEYYISENTLYRARRKFYENWFKKTAQKGG